MKTTFNVDLLYHVMVAVCLIGMRSSQAARHHNKRHAQSIAFMESQQGTRSSKNVTGQETFVAIVEDHDRVAQRPTLAGIMYTL
jgi:hypothetical protein